VRDRVPGRRGLALSLRGIRDGRWQRGFVRFARAAGAPVLPVRVEARNSALFYGASTLFKPAGTALLAREMFTRRGRPLRLSIGEPMQLGKGGDPGAQLLAVRRALYALGRNGAAGNAAAAQAPSRWRRRCRLRRSPPALPRPPSWARPPTASRSCWRPAPPIRRCCWNWAACAS
jgi:1-acyl-sn-glycerol-3-phosphate acyltransferase